MVEPAPKIDKRTAEDVAKQVQLLLAQYLPEEFREPLQTGITAALIKIFARFSEIVIQRLNQVPDKNFLAFLDLLGASRLPPQPARVPLTFSLAAGSAVDAVVPAGTQVAAPPAEGQSEPVIFETERELVVTAAQLESIFVRDPEQDTWSNRTSLVTATASPGVPVFRGNQPIEHILYLGHQELLGFPDIENLKLIANLSKALGDGGQVKWQIWQETESEAKWIDIKLTKEQDKTQTFTQLGSNEIDFGRITAVPIKTINSVTNRWLRCCLLTSITLSETAQSGMVRNTQLPKLEQLTFVVSLNRSNLAIEAAFFNQLPIDITKFFFPFGEKPKFGDTLYLANREVFSKQDAKIALDIRLTNPASGGDEPPIPRTKADGNPELKWEFWNGKNWVELGTAKRQNVQPAGSNQFEDSTQAFTANGSVRFTFPEPPVATTINGVENLWIRVRLAAGDYGKEAQYTATTRPVVTRVTTTEGGKTTTTETTTQTTDYVFTPASFAPPSISSVSVNYTFTKTEEPESILTYNDAVYSNNIIQVFNQQKQWTEKPLVPFKVKATDKPSIYWGFTLPPGRTSFPNRAISLFNRIPDFKYGEKWGSISPTQSRLVGEANSTVTHKFLLANDTSKSVTFAVAALGTNWTTTVVAQSLKLEAGATQPLDVRVTIPSASNNSDRTDGIVSDRGFLRVTSTDNPSLVYSASFETFRGLELPKEERPKLSWQYWNGKEWTKLTVRDDTENLTRSGLVEFLAPTDFSAKDDFDLSARYWLRVQWEGGDYSIEPRLQRVLLNTTMAAQTVTIRNEVLGSSDGSENQKFRLTQTPVLKGQSLEVQEPELPAVEEQKRLKQVEGEEAIATTPDASGRPQEIWVRWHEVADFYGSGSRDRHYVLDRLTGEIQFGNGLNGLIPPVGTGNLRMAYYQTGGGTAGNKPAGTIVQLKTTVPYVDKVTNTEAAAGGADAENLESLRDREPRKLRHNNRAVTLEDYEDLARLASPDVARAKCIPLVDLQNNDGLNVQNPPGQTPKAPGQVGVIIVPRSTEAKPLPSLELIRRVQDYLEAHCLPTVTISVVGPLYISVSVSAEIAVTSPEGASAVKQSVEQKLASFLHPLTGGLDGKGWDFGREAHDSDVYALIEAIPGVSYVRTLNVSPPPYPAGVKETGRFLVYSGNHEINFVF